MELVSFLTWVIDNDGEYLQEAYRKDFQRLFIATMQYSGYLHNKGEMKSEKASVAKDYEDAGINTSANAFFYAEVDPHHYLKELRLRILYFNKNHQATTTLRQILCQYGHRQRNHEVIEEIEEHLAALQLLVFDGAQEKNLFKTKLDDRLVLKVEI